MTPASQGRLALFDLDNTLIPIDSDVAWAQHLVDLGVVERDWYSGRNDYFYEQYKVSLVEGGGREEWLHYPKPQTQEHWPLPTVPPSFPPFLRASSPG